MAAGVTYGPETLCSFNEIYKVLKRHLTRTALLQSSIVTCVSSCASSLNDLYHLPHHFFCGNLKENLANIANIIIIKQHNNGIIKKGELMMDPCTSKKDM